MRFLYFFVGVVMYNAWRMANFILRDDVNVHLGILRLLQARSLS